MVPSLEKIDKTFYFCSNPIIGGRKLYSYNLTNESDNDFNLTAQLMTIADNKIYYYDQSDKSLKSCSLTENDVNVIATQVEITDLKVIDNILYYTDSRTGTHSYNLTTQQDKLFSTHYCSSLVKVGNKLYFTDAAITYSNDYPSASKGDGHIYSVNIDGSGIIKIA